MLTLADSESKTTLATVLVRLCRECDVDIELLRAEQVLGEVQEAWPGDERRLWRKWLVESCESLHLRARQVELTMEEVEDLAKDGAKLVGSRDSSGEIQVVVGKSPKGLLLGEGPFEATRVIALTELLASTIEQSSPAQHEWVVVEHPELTNIHDAQHLHDRPIERLLRIIRPEWSDIWIILVFALFAGVLNLATPIAVEALVNTVAFGQLLQPVVVLAVMLFIFLAFAALLRALQTYVAEIIQRRLFARVAADLAYRLPRVDARSLTNSYGPELVNRFLDVATLQKVVANLLLDGVSIALATLVGMTVLAFYHPWLLGFDLLLIATVSIGLVLLGRGAIASGIDESKLKYKLTAWFEEVTRCQLGFKADGGPEFAFDRANQLTAQYLKIRQSHFRILFRQIVFTLGLQAVAGTVLLGVGGWLVIQGQLSLGQLVAAELIVTTILASLAKLGKHIEGFYDLVAAVDKLGYLFDLEVEKPSGLTGVLNTGAGLSLRLTDLRSKTGDCLATHGFTASIAAGEHVAIIGAAGSGKTTLARMIYGLEQPVAGQLEIGDCDPTDLRPDLLRAAVAIAGETEIIDSSIAENLRLGRPYITSSHVRHALEQTGLLESIITLPDGIDQRLLPTGRPLSSNQQRLLMIARAIAGDPELLVIDGILDSLPEEQLDKVLATLLSAEQSWTLIVMTTRQEIAARLDRHFWLRKRQAA
ncbi:ATP-binding cassette domain-containing protein [Aeoliella sp. ICT_H6.2]|uniref:ATP-binding cassette domain-containing protein n=1 Tax=Aeoliella straminimaris TaxID=2954799 RepID=A0A9X2JJ89_9BACT|nr:ATP-binding cassette domain-containing protein [Aeoliella straminimaris]MCO6044744.1 ATP-binding cassette domain-containing protein [Aeoliella straminimaris]